MLPTPRTLVRTLFWLLLALALVVASCIMFARDAHAATYWVSPTGNAGNSGADSTSNAKTLAWVNSNATSGDIIRFKSGTYSDKIAPTHSNNTTARIRFYGFPQDRGGVHVAGMNLGTGTQGAHKGDYVTIKWMTMDAGDMSLEGFSRFAGGTWAAGEQIVGDSVVGCTFVSGGASFTASGSCIVDSCSFTKAYSGSGYTGQPINFEGGGAGPCSGEIPSWPGWSGPTTNCKLMHSSVALTFNGSGNYQAIHSACAAYNEISDCTIAITSNMTPATGYSFICEEYFTYYFSVLRNTITLNAVQDWSQGNHGIFTQRDSSQHAHYIGNTIRINGTGGGDGLVSNSGHCAGTTGWNLWDHNTIITALGPSPGPSTYNSLLFWQNGARSDTVQFNTFVASGNLPVFGIYNGASSDLKIDGLLVRHNTCWTGAKTAAAFGVSNTVANSPRFTSNLWYSTNVNSAGNELVKVRSGIGLDSAGTFFTRGGDPTKAIAYGGVAGTPGSGGNYGVSGKAVWGSPQFMDSTLATLNVSPHSFGYAQGVKVPSLADGFSGVFSDSTGSSIGSGPVTYTITATPGSNGTISPTGAVSVASGSNQVFSMAANTGYTLTDVTVDGGSVGAVATYTFTNVVATHTISSTNTINTYTITSSAGSNGSISPSGATVKNYNTSQTYTMTPSGSYHVANVLVDGVSVGAPTSYTFSNIAATHTISVTFALDSAPPSIINVTISKLNSRWIGAQWDVVNDADTNCTVVAGISDVSTGPFDTTLAAVRLPGSSHYATSVFGLAPIQGRFLRIYVDDGANGKDSSKTSYVTAHEVGDHPIEPIPWVRQPIKGPMIYVDPQGADDSDGRNPYQPMRTIRAAYQKLIQQPSHGLGGAVVLAPGVYYQNNTLDDSDNFDASDQYARSDSMYHIVGSDPNTTIISGADERLESGSLTLTWTSYGADSIWMAYYPADDSIGGVWFDGVLGANAIRCYKYTSITEIRNGAGSSGGGTWVWHSWGWYGRNDTLFVRTPDGTSPALHAIHTAYRPNLLYLRDPNIRVTGIGFQFAGDAGLPGNGIALRFGTGNGATNRASNCEVDSCIFRNNTREAIYSIAAQSGLNDSIRVYDNEFYDDVEKFGYSAGKGRGEEQVDVVQTDGSWWTIMNNSSSGHFNGITATGDSTKLNREMEMTVAYNSVQHVADDAFEFDGGCAVNFRFFKNRATRFNNGLSLAPVYRGPVWDIYNIFSYPSPGGGIWKLGNGNGSRLTGVGYHIHDTGYSPNGSNTTGIYGVGQIKQQHWINSQFSGSASNWKPIRVSPTAGFDAADSTGNRSNDVNWCVMYNWSGANLAADWFGAAYDTTTIKSSLVWQKNGLFSNPGFADTSEAVANYTPRASGRDAGRRIAGINDNNQFVTLVGSGPDIGALEYSPPDTTTTTKASGHRRRVRIRYR